MEIYATTSAGIGGKIKQTATDFIVEEILVDGSKAEVNSTNSTNRTVLGSTLSKSQYLLCVLVKRNWDTFIAIQNIAKALGIRATQIQFAGIKDAKAVTAQHITVEQTSFEDLADFRVKDMEIAPVGYVKNKLSPYYLKGNGFNVTIRDLRKSEKIIRERIATIIDEINGLGGIPNFFGHQRFGTIRPITHLVGKAIVNGDLAKAAWLFLAKPSCHEHPSSEQARLELQKTRDFEKALQTFPRQLRYERFMLRSLSKNPTDFSSAFRRIPIRLRRIFVQSYQSYLFNRFLSGRMKHRFSLTRAEIGDYVVSIERSGLTIPAIHKTVTPTNQTEINNSIQDGKVRIALPLLGLKQPPSQGIQGEIEREIMLEEAISMENFQVSALPEMSSKGELRSIVTPVKDLQVSEIFDDSISTSRRAAKITFTLNRGSYATVVLRELMKTRNPLEAGF